MLPHIIAQTNLIEMENKDKDKILSYNKMEKEKKREIKIPISPLTKTMKKEEYICLSNLEEVVLCPSSYNNPKTSPISNKKTFNVKSNYKSDDYYEKLQECFEP